MLLQPFQHHRPRSLEEALDIMDRHGDEASYYAGGTELLLAMKARVLRYEHLIDLKGLGEIRGIQTTSTDVVIGALSTHLSLAQDPSIRAILPAYARLSENVANIRVRAQGTLGGNLCFAEPHADPPTLLAAFDAKLLLKSRAGARMIAMRDFVSGEFSTEKAADEILCEIHVPRPGPGARFAYRSFGHLERPAVSVAIGHLPIDGYHDYTFFVGALTSTPVALSQLAARMRDVPPAHLAAHLEETAEEAVASLETVSDLLGSADYKRHLVSVMLRRACHDLVAGGHGGRSV
jgi:carbon-monoxide dehydrogenase medium subunit